MKRREILIGGLAAGVGVPFQSAHGQASAWPSREVKVILPVSAGGANDALARAVFEHVGKQLGTPFVISNNPGGGAVLGTALLAQAKPDGYTIGNVSYSGLLLTPHTMKVPYKLSDFDFLGSAGEPLYGLAVGPNSPVKNMADFVALAKQREITCASNTIVNMVCMFNLATMTGAKIKWIPTKTQSEPIVLTSSGDVDCALQSGPELTAGAAGNRIKLIASANQVRWASMPQMPTMIEQGFAVFNSVPLGYGLPVGVDPVIRRKLEAAILVAARSPEIVEMTSRLGVASRPLDAQGLAKTFQAAAPEMEKLIADAGMKKSS